MDTLAQWLATITWPLVTRVMVSLGLGTVTYTGADTALRSAMNQVKDGFMGLSAEVLQLVLMAGLFEAMAIMSGGLFSGLAWLTMKHLALRTTAA